jgi:hypothetical protein
LEVGTPLRNVTAGRRRGKAWFDFNALVVAGGHSGVI